MVKGHNELIQKIQKINLNIVNNMKSKKKRRKIKKKRAKKIRFQTCKMTNSNYINININNNGPENVKKENRVKNWRNNTRRLRLKSNINHKTNNPPRTIKKCKTKIIKSKKNIVII